MIVVIGKTHETIRTFRHRPPPDLSAIAAADQRQAEDSLVWRRVTDRWDRLDWLDGRDVESLARIEAEREGELR